MNRWLRVVLPHWGIVLFVIGLTQLIVSLMQWYWFGNPLKRPDDDDARPLTLAVGFAMLAYSHYRVLAFHPLWREEYFNWLKETPWRRGLPLPIGPVHLVPQDLFLVAVAVGLGWWWGQGIPVIWLQLIPLVFLGGYLLTLAMTLWQCGLWGFAYLVGFCLGACVWLIGNWGPMWISVAITYGVAQFGVIRGWEQFPWSVEKLHRTLKRSFKGLQGEAMVSPDALGWPFEALSPQPGPELFVERHDAWLLSLMAGWWVYAAGVQVQAFDTGAILFVIFAPVYLVVMPLAIARLNSYFKGVGSPLDFHGRFFTPRWIVPSHDVAWLPFLLSFFCFANGFAVLIATRWFLEQWPWWDSAVVAGVTVSITLLLLLVPGPQLRRWRLTGNVRLMPGQGGLGGSLQSGQQRGQYVQCH